MVASAKMNLLQKDILESFAAMDEVRKVQLKIIAAAMAKDFPCKKAWRYFRATKKKNGSQLRFWQRLGD